MLKPKQSDYKKLEAQLQALDGLRHVPPDGWFPSPQKVIEDIGVEGCLKSMRFLAVNSFLSEHTSIEMISAFGAQRRMPDKSWVIHGGSMQGIEIDVCLCRNPETGRYSITSHWRESIELIAATPDEPYIEGTYIAREADAEGLMGLVRALVEVDFEPEKATHTKPIGHVIEAEGPIDLGKVADELRKKLNEPPARSGEESD
jgi:hypothetical protein